MTTRWDRPHDCTADASCNAVFANGGESQGHGCPADRFTASPYQFNWRCLSLATVVFLTCSYAPPVMAAPVNGWQNVQKLVEVVSAWKGDKADPSVNRQAAKYIDYQSMAQRSLGDEQWAKLNAGQKSQFTATLRNLMEQRYYPRWHRIFVKAKLQHVSDTASGADTLVKTHMLVGKKSDELVWRLTGKGDPKVVSLAIGDKDLLTKLKVRLQDKLAKSNFASLLSWMQSKAKQQSSAEEVSSAEAVIGESK